MNSIKVIIFDVFDTLIHIETDETNAFAYDFLSSWLSYLGITIKADDFYESFRRNTDVEFNENPNQYPDVEIGDVFRRLYSEIKIPSSLEINQLVKETALLFRILTTKSLMIYPETHTVLMELYSFPGIRLCIASNTQRLFTIPELRKFDLEKYFEYIVFSSDVKVCKPNPKLFIAALEGMKAEPAEAIFVGNNLFDDIGGAQSIGIKTIWIDRGENNQIPKNHKKPTPDDQIVGQHFAELPDKIYKLINTPKK